MIHDDPDARGRNPVSPTSWTPRRTKLAGLAGLLGGAGGLLGSVGGFGLVGVSLGDAGAGITLGATIVIYAVLHILMAVGVLAANAWYGRRSRIVARLLVLSLVGEAASILVLMLVRTDLGELLIPIGIFHATTWMAIRFFGSLYGVTLWRDESVSRLTSGLFVVLFPAIFILALLTQIGFPGQLIVVPLDLAFIALGYELWVDAADVSPRESGVTG